MSDRTLKTRMATSTNRPSRSRVLRNASPAGPRPRGRRLSLPLMVFTSSKSLCDLVLSQSRWTDPPSLAFRFVKATPRVERRSRSTASPQAAPQSPKDVPFSPQPDSRASSRASTKYSDAGHGSHFRARSVVSFLFSTSSSRASTPSMSMDSLSSSVSGADDDEGAARKKGGRFRRAMRKLLK
jgi:hypothetical protein